VPALYALWFPVHSDEARVGDPDLQTFDRGPATRRAAIAAQKPAKPPPTIRILSGMIAAGLAVKGFSLGAIVISF
jgi:hypothetical protein